MATEADLKTLLEQSWALDADLAELMDGLPDPSTSRQAIVRGMCSTSHSHYHSQRVLLEVGTTPTVLALVRLHYESVVRSLWYAAGAGDDWIDRMKLENSKDNGEPVLGPPIDSMLDRLGQVAPLHVSMSLRALKEASWKPMNSLVHGGIHAILTGLVDLNTPHQWVGVVKNANGLATMNAQALLISLNDLNNAGLLAALQKKHLKCLPA